VSVGRGNRKTRKIHAAGVLDRRFTLCTLARSRRYVRAGNEGPDWAVNCQDCLKVLVDTCTYPEFLQRAGLAKKGPNGFPVRKCRKCGEFDEFTSESDAHGLCVTCMHYVNRPSP
jgi:hypothetical protein